MEIPTVDTHIAADSAVLEELLGERLNARGITPQAPAMDAEGGALLVWLENDEKGIPFVCSAAPFWDSDGASAVAAKDFADELAYPVLVFMLRQGHGIPEGTEVSFNG